MMTTGATPPNFAPHRIGHNSRRFRDRRIDPGVLRARKLEGRYAVDLRRVARQIGMIVKGWAPDDATFDMSKVPGLQHALEQYSRVIRPWAESTAGRILAEIAIKERRAWARHAEEMSRALHLEIVNAPTGAVLRQALQDQVGLITSLPIEAGQRVHELTLKGLENGTRAPEIAREILRTGEVTESRATLIARTEVSRTASTLTMARAVHVGSPGYFWRTSRDRDVRESHARMEGKVVEWAKPPTLDGLTGHAGCTPNCRCWPEAILPEF